jgi:4-amino-4-deoxy-L-arabinose transferase-like glycosyltransferase
VSQRADHAVVAWVRAHPVVAAVCAIVAVHAAFDVVWLLQYRHPFTGTIDETQFLTASWSDAQALRHAQPHTLWTAFHSFTWFAPLLPLLSAPLLAVHVSPVVAILVQIPLLALTVAAAAAIGDRLGGARVAIVTSIAVAALPALIEGARSYNFTVISTAFFTASVASLLLSDGLRSRRWSAALGVCVGLCALSRLVMLALLPAVVVAAVIVVAMSRERRARVVNLGVAAGCGLVVAGPWYAENLGNALHYLRTYGYGAVAGDFGTSYSASSLQYWTAKASLTARAYLFLPLTVIVLVALACGVALLVRAARRRSVATHRDALILGGIVLAGYLVLSTSANEGTGFEVALLPCVLALSMLALVRVGGRWFRRGVTLAVAAIAAANLAVSAGSAASLYVLAPGLGATAVVDGRADVDFYAAVSDPRWTASASVRAAWAAVPMDLASRLSALALSHGRQPVALLATRDRLANYAAVRADCEFDEGRPAPWVGGLDSAGPAPDVAGYASLLTGFNLLVTSPTDPSDFPPILVQSDIEAAARSDGFQPAFDITLPNGRVDHVWWRDSGLPADAAPAGSICGA